MTVKNFLGAAAATTLTSGITSGTTTFDVASASGYPSANFNIVIDRGLAGEEKVLITSRSGNTFTVGSRGYDGTTAAAHSTAAVVEHCIAAVDQQENNDHLNATAAHGATGAVVGTTNTQTLSNKQFSDTVEALASNDTANSAGGLVGFIVEASAQSSTPRLGLLKRGAEGPGLYVNSVSNMTFRRLSGTNLNDASLSATDMGYFDTNNNLQLSGFAQSPITFLSASASLGSQTATVIFQGTTASQTFTISAAASGRRLQIYNDSTQTWTLSASGTSFLGSSAASILLPSGGWVDMVGYGSNWLVPVHSSIYTPAWTCAGTAPSLGNGTLSGRYTRSGNLVRGSIRLAAGTTTTFGTNDFRFQLPFNIGSFSSGTGNAVGRATINDNSSGNIYFREAWTWTNDNIIIRDETTTVTSVAPFTWANLDILQAEFSFYV